MKNTRAQVKAIVKLLYYLVAIWAAVFMLKVSLCKANDPIPTTPETIFLVINEVYPNPISSSDQEILTKEWIELYNPGVLDADLSDYVIVDEANHSFSELTGLIIRAGEYLVVSDENILNNAGDAIFLKNEAGVVDQVIYGDTTNNHLNAKLPPVGKSITRISDAPDTDVDSIDFVVGVPTPGFAYDKEEDALIEGETLSIEETREKENGEDITVIGIVTSLPGILSSQYFYIEDQTGGMQIYCHSKMFPTLALGDSVSVAGELSQTNNERRIKIDGSDKIIILNHTDPVVPNERAISDIGEENEGTYVKTAGIVTETSGDTFYISDGQSEIKVVINKSTGINKPKMKKGDQVEVSGIVSQYKDEYRILPIDQDDVKIIASEGQLPRAGNGELIYLIISLFLSIIWNIFLGAKRKLIA